jgi:exodeoxyribonuclease VII small subunit
MIKKDFSYSESITELEEILAEIEDDKVELDVLMEKVVRATSLIKECKSVLRKTSEEIDSFLGDWEKED